MDRHPLRRMTPGELPSPQIRLFSPEVDGIAARAIADVREKGKAGLRAWAEKLGELSPAEPLLAGRDELEAAYARVNADVKELLARAQSRSRFRAPPRNLLTDIDIAVRAAGGHSSCPSRRGCNVPGGHTPSLHGPHDGPPAIAAGVREVWCAARSNRHHLGRRLRRRATGSCAAASPCHRALAFGVGSSQ